LLSSYVARFDGTDPNLTLFSSPGFSATFTGTEVIFAKDAFTGNGSVGLITNFQALGDFQATVEGTRIFLVPNGEMGLSSGHAGGFADIFFVGPNTINANIFVSPGFGFRSVSDSSLTVTFRIMRTGNTLALQYDEGGGFITVHSATHPNLAGPVSIDIFLLQEFGNTTANSGSFKNLQITADSFSGFKPPAVVAMNGSPFVSVEGASSGPQILATFTDPSGPDQVNNYSADITWGDGTPTEVGGGNISVAPNGVFTVKGSHTYAEESALEHPGSQPYTITVVIHHKSAPTATASDTATVSDPAVVAKGVPVSAKECVASTAAVATFTDPGGPELVSDYSATIAWGDSTTSAGTIAFGGGVFTVKGSHAYASEGAYTITTTIHHEATTAQMVTSTATVKDNLGLLVLDPTGEEALMVSGHGSITLNNCGAVIVNSKDDEEAASLSGYAMVAAADIDITGGAETTGHAKFSSPIHHEAPTPDSLGLPLPPAPAAIFAAVHYDKSTPLHLKPGTYVGGIHVSGQGKVILDPGVYYMKGGGFEVSGHGSVTGDGVLLVNAPHRSSDDEGDNEGDDEGAVGRFRLTGQATVNLAAPTSLTGPYAAYNGITLLQDPASSAEVEISGQGSLTMTGVFYAKKAKLALSDEALLLLTSDSAHSIGAEVVVKDVMITGDSDLTINPDPPAPPPGGSASPGGRGSGAAHAPMEAAGLGGTADTVPTNVALTGARGLDATVPILGGSSATQPASGGSGAAAVPQPVFVAGSPRAKSNLTANDALFARMASRADGGDLTSDSLFIDPTALRVGVRRVLPIAD
jgi:hypothetical protein